MRFYILVLFFLFLVPSPISAWFFPNSSAIPPDLYRNTTENLWNSFMNFTGCHTGQKVNGLNKLKQYFYHFGYIPNNFPTNFTDDFDETLKNAIELYQTNFRLNITGELDEFTLKHVVSPRCGNPDIVNGTSTMRSTRRANEVSFSGRGSRFHAVKLYSFFPGEPKWPLQRRDLTYAFDPRNTLTEEVKSVFSRAFARWAKVSPITFSRVETFQTSDITIGFYSGEHGDRQPFDGVLNTLAHAFAPPTGSFHLDADETWVDSIDGDRILSVTAAIDLESVAVHEIGHLLGLGHSSVENSIMYPTLTTGTRKVDLTSDDIEGIQYLYGSNLNINGSSSPSATPQRETGDFGAGFRMDGSRFAFTSLLLSTVTLLWS